MNTCKGASSGMCVEEAMRVLNMKKFDAQELNEKFRFRVQSVAQGLGGSLVDQKNIYSAWEYLNRMLARESSNRAEKLIKNADKAVRMNEVPRRSDMMPFKLSNLTKKASAVVEKKDKTRKTEAHMKSILKINDQESIQKLPPIQGVKPLTDENTRGNSPDDSAIKHVSWNENKNVIYSDNNSDKTQSKKHPKRKLILRSVPSRPRRKTFAKKENAVVQTREGKAVRNVTSSEEDESTESMGTDEILRGLIEKHPKLWSMPTIPFKMLPELNDIYANPKKLSKHDERANALRTLWKVGSDHILKDVFPDQSKRKLDAHVGGKIRTSSLKLRKSLRKQEEVLYRKFHLESFPEIPTVTDRPTRGLLREQKAWNLSTNMKSVSKGPYIPSRIKNWMETSGQPNPE